VKCPTCHREDTIRVIRTTSSNSDYQIRRERLCSACGKRFWTIETLDQSQLTVRKHGGRREAFDREKLRNSVRRACYRLDIDTDDQENLISEVADEAARIAVEAKDSIPAAQIGNLVLTRLWNLSPVAWLRYYAYFYDEGSGAQERLRSKLLEALDDRSIISQTSVGISSNTNFSRSS
jgi:transcriptional repressor NrdR